MILPQFVLRVYNKLKGVYAVNEYIIDAIAQSNNTESDEIKNEIEALAEYCDTLRGMRWDEIVVFLTTLTVLDMGYCDLF